jgi:hypothetical protein
VIDPYAIPDDEAKAYVAVSKIAASLRAGLPVEFMVSLRCYYIEGERYLASGLTISRTATPRFVQTQAGFTCEAYFPTHLLKENAVRGKQVVKGTVPVGMEVRLADVWLIVAFPDPDSDEYITLFQREPGEFLILPGSF